MTETAKKTAKAKPAETGSGNGQQDPQEPTVVFDYDAVLASNGRMLEAVI